MSISCCLGICVLVGFLGVFNIVDFGFRLRNFGGKWIGRFYFDGITLVFFSLFFLYTVGEYNAFLFIVL